MLKNKWKGIVFSLIVWGGLMLAGTQATYEPTPHDQTFTTMMTYKVQELIDSRGAEFASQAVGVLRNFGQKYADEDLRFAYLVNTVADNLEQKMLNGDFEPIENEYVDTDIYNLEAQSPASAESCSLQLSQVSRDSQTRKITLSIQRNRRYFPSAARSLPSVVDNTIHARAHCSIGANVPIPGGGETLSVYGIRGKPYFGSLKYWPMNIPESVSFEDDVVGVLEVPEAFVDGEYSRMCQVMIEELDSSGEHIGPYYETSYYYFDTEIAPSGILDENS